MNTPAARLIARPSSAMTALLDSYGEHLRRVLPLKAAHFRELPRAAADLSRLLTEERKDMTRPYWSNPRSLGAYAWYFLPWNLYRLSWLLPNLSMPLKDGDCVLDIGSGPLTLPQALWIARPDLRDAKLTFICSDIASQPLELGRALLSALMAVHFPDRERMPWTVRTVRAGLDQALREAGCKPKQSVQASDRDAAASVRSRGANLILAGNILNEIKAPRSMPMELHMRVLSWRLARALAPGGYAFFVEPGNRLGGKILSLLRKNALELGLRVLAPCTHEAPCPMRAPRCAFWCHFRLDANLAPDWLHELSALAGLKKDWASLSMLMLQRPQSLARLRPETEFFEAGLADEPDSAVRDGNAGQHPSCLDKNRPLCARVLSEAFSVPNAKGRCRYACTESGLVLLENADAFPESVSAAVRQATPPRRDPKTGALICEAVHAKRP